MASVKRLLVSSLSTGEQIGCHALHGAIILSGLFEHIVTLAKGAGLQAKGDEYDGEYF